MKKNFILKACLIACLIIAISFTLVVILEAAKAGSRPCETHEAIISLRGALNEFKEDIIVKKICDLGSQDSKVLNSNEYRDLVKYLNSKKHLHWVWASGGEKDVYTDAWGKEFTIQVTKESDGLKFVVSCNSSRYNNIFEHGKYDK